MLGKYTPGWPKNVRRAYLARLITSGKLKAGTVYKNLLALEKLYSPTSSWRKIVRGDARWVRSKYYGSQLW